MFGYPVLVFDIETVTDVKAGSQLYGLDLPLDDAQQALNKLRRQEAGTEFPRTPLHEIVCISGLWIDQDKFQLFSWTRENFSEIEILQKFVGIFEKKSPILVSWNGGQFDLPVIMYRCLYHGVTAANLFEQGDWNPQKRHNNYQNRYHARHTDLMDVLASFNIRNFQKLDDVAQILGYPGKRGLSGYHVEDYVKQQQWLDLSSYCEGDVLNTWLIYLRWLLLRGFIQQAQHQDWIRHTILYLQQQPQHAEFLEIWQQTCLSTVFTQSDFNGI
ncbi:MAG: 3'-5' exonuclease [Acinetobacter populi]|nr:3'-5' exonuclease [Acinetobacter populi]MCH4247522.1 3'-5' exonuclease [Acinetobacter populi]